MLRPQTGATGEFSKLGLAPRWGTSLGKAKRNRAGGAWGVEKALGHARPRDRAKDKSCFSSSHKVWRGARISPTSPERRASGRRAAPGGRAGDSRVQGRVAAGRSVIPTDKRGSLSRAHNAAERGLGQGRLHCSVARRGGGGPRRDQWKKPGPPRQPGLPRRAAQRSLAPRPVRSRAGTR